MTEEIKNYENHWMIVVGPDTNMRTGYLNKFSVKDTGNFGAPIPTKEEAYLTAERIIRELILANNKLACLSMSDQDKDYVLFANIENLSKITLEIIPYEPNYLERFVGTSKAQLSLAFNFDIFTGMVNEVVENNRG